MKPNFDESLQNLFCKAAAAGIFSKAVAGFILPDGKTEVFPFETHRDSVFDIASLTKVCPTSTLALKRILEGKLGLDDKVIDYIPELHTNYRESILVRHLLTHSLDYCVPMSTLKKLPPEKILDSLFHYHFNRIPGSVFNYGNPASILLGMILSRLSHKTLQEMGNDELFIPLGMTRSGYNPKSLVPIDEIIPTENCSWRKRLIQGEVHDESAFVLQKLFPVGSAGMFSTVPDLLKFVQMLLNDGTFEGKRIIPSGVLEMISTNALEGRIPATCTALGWELNSEKFMGKIHSPHTFGKTGFTGASIVADRDKKAAVVLLSNFTYPERETSATRIHEFRANLSELFFKYI